MYIRIGILGRARQAMGIARLHAPREALYIDVKYNSLTHSLGSHHVGRFMMTPGATSIMSREFTNKYLQQPNQVEASYLASEAGVYASQRPENLLFAHYGAMRMTLPAQSPSPPLSRHIRIAMAVPRGMSTDLEMRL